MIEHKHVDEEDRMEKICYNTGLSMKTIKLPFKVKSAILACGADMKGAFALAKSDKAYLFDGFGDLSQLDNFTKYKKAIEAARAKLKVMPGLVVCDLHPGYFSTQFAENYTLSAKCYTLFEVQHHEAHIASAIVDNDIKGDVLGVAFDGTGYGLDGRIWGGEFFIGRAKKFRRAAHLEYIPMPGGDMAIREPWRMAASYIYSASGDVKSYYGKRWDILKRMIENNINSPMTSSMGRLFDAVGSLVLNREISEFEAQLPLELEEMADRKMSGCYDFDLEKRDGATIVNMAGTIRGILKDLDRKAPGPGISAKFHNTVASMIFKAAKRFNAKDVVLSGGVFQNKFLSRKTRELLTEGGFKVYIHSNVETNDSGIPLGQIAIANARALCA